MRRALLLASMSSFVCVLTSACLDRPVTATEPRTSNLYVEPIRNQVIDKLDLLFMIDNSQSMGDKQLLLAKAVPQLVDRLVVPRCVGNGGGVQLRASVDEKCPAGMQPEFRAVRDIHVAVITSSLGAHGASNGFCKPGGTVKHPDDRALLLPSVRPDLASYESSGFLAWDPDRALVPPGEVDAAQLKTNFESMVQSAGEDGCGYEASLEAWYRFLIDPEPPRTLELVGTAPNLQTVVTSVDTDVLEQRKKFLRPDSLVAIIMLTDENDCSVREDAWGYMAADSRNDEVMWRGNSACVKDPNDPCCAPCAATAPEGCVAHTADATCQSTASGRLLASEDSLNLRCLENKRRFGYDFLYPTSRYVDGLTKLKVPKRSTGELVDNPLFAVGPSGTRRDIGLVYLAGIVGVPWQDIADDASLTGAGLRYLTARELTERDRWDVLVGNRATNTPPSDPFMRESIAPRSGTNPITGDAIAPETSTNPRENAINGHEQKPSPDDLQLACTFELPGGEPKPCDAEGTCDCKPADPLNPTKSPGDLPKNSPLCQPPGGGAWEPKQYFGKAYPGLRPLEVLKGIGDSAIVASICPKVLQTGQPGYGYEPAVDALVDRLRIVLSGRCLPRPLAIASNGELPCVVVEAAATPAGGACACDAQSRSAASVEASSLVRRRLKERLECDTPETPTCDSLCLCELAPSSGDALTKCLNDEVGPDTPGYCYVHPFGEAPSGNADLVANCEEGQKQLLRFVGRDTPRPGATAVIACLGATLH